LGQDVGRCAGCDVCEGSPTLEPEGQREILAAVRRHARRLTVRELSLLLTALPRPETHSKGLDRLAGFGILAHWAPEDVDTALETLRLAGWLRVPGRGPWRDRVLTGDTARRRPAHAPE
jgi:hypothetical protein